MHRGYVICCKTSLPGAGKTGNMYLFFFVVKSRISLCFLQQLFATYNKLISCKTGLIRGWPDKTDDIAM